MGRVEKINAFHNKLLFDSEIVKSAEICGWSSTESQNDRFLALVRSGQFEGGTVVDYGCGAGDLFQFLSRLGHKFEYIGLDQNPKMLELARKRHSATFEVIQPDEICFDKTDYVFASGIFQFCDEEQPEYYKTLLSRLYERSKRALVVNFLSSLRAASEKDADELYLSPPNLIDFAQQITKCWRLDHSYHPGFGDMTLALIRQESFGNWKRPK